MVLVVKTDPRGPCSPLPFCLPKRLPAPEGLPLQSLLLCMMSLLGVWCLWATCQARVPNDSHPLEVSLVSQWQQLYALAPSCLGWNNSEALTLRLPSGINLGVIVHGFIICHLLAVHPSLTPPPTFCPCFFTSPINHLYLNPCLRV